MKKAWQRCSVTRRFRPRPYPRPCMGGELAVDGRREKQLDVRSNCVILYLLISPSISLYLLPLIRTANDWGFVVRARDAWRKYNDRVRGAR